MKTRVRIREKDTVKAYLTKGGKLIASLYDSGFTTVSQVIATLDNKVSDYNKGKGELYYSILNEDKGEHKGISKRIR